ncbi:MAG: DUF4915 domain-containing protein, partial [Pseudomonadota bacterium]
RNNQTFDDLALEQLLQQKDTAPRCGLIIVDITTGRLVEWLRFEHTIEELYDVAVLDGVAQPELTGFMGETIKRRVSHEPLVSIDSIS